MKLAEITQCGGTLIDVDVKVLEEAILRPKPSNQPTPTQKMDDLFSLYSDNKTPIPVNFRELVPFYSGIDRASHLVHPYPAKLLANIPFFLLRCKQFGPPGILLDPFCGSGTVLLEAALAGWRPLGADANPLARLISRVKLTHIEGESVETAIRRVCEFRGRSVAKFSPVVNVHKWYSDKARSDIARIMTAIQLESDENIRDFLLVALSSCLKKLSFADPRLSVPVRVKSNHPQWKLAQRPNVTKIFERSAISNLKRVASLASIDPAMIIDIKIAQDARDSTVEEDVDLVITSPPYVGAQKYVRASSLSIGWLSLAPNDRLRPVEDRNIGREHYPKSAYTDNDAPFDGVAAMSLNRIRSINPLRAHIARTYLDEMQAALTATARRLRRGRYAVIIVGNNTICGEEFETARYISELAGKAGLVLRLELLDDIRSRGLMTKRNKTASVISREHVQVYEKI